MKAATWRFILSFPVSLMRAAAVMYLWRWFVVPIGVHPVGLLGAWGLSELVGYMTQRIGGPEFDDVGEEKKELRKNASLVFSAFMAPIVLVIGYAIHLLQVYLP